MKIYDYKEKTLRKWWKISFENEKDNYERLISISRDALQN